MPEIIIRPTRKWISFSYTVTIILICVVVFAYNNYYPDQTKWPLAITALLLLWPLSQDFRQRFTKMVIAGDKLRYECGILSKTVRTIQLTKVQDVRVDQSLWQRIFRLGNISIETAGETSRLTMANIDRPQEVADEISDAAQGPAPKRKGERE